MTKHSDDKVVFAKTKDAELKRNRGSDGKKKKNTVKFTMFGYCILQFLCSVIRIFMHGKSRRTEAYKRQLKSGASLILANHISAFDFIFYIPTLRGGKCNFVVAENMMIAKPIFAKLLTGYGVIVKKQNFADFQCIKNIKRYLDAGISVLLCPEGKVAADGKTGVISESIAKLVKWLGYPVLYIVNKGSGLMRPKWAHKNRKVKILSECDLMLTADEIKKLPQNEIYEKINKSLEHNEHAYQQENHMKVRGKRLAEGLERQLYYCPKCGAEFQNFTENDMLKCARCSNAVRYTPLGDLVAVGEGSVSLNRIDLWSDIQRALVAKEVQNENFKLSNQADLFIENEDKSAYKFIAPGEISLTRSELRFTASANERNKDVQTSFGINSMGVVHSQGDFEPVEEEFKLLIFNAVHLSTVANIPGDTIDLYDDKHMYRIVFTKARASTKYATAIEEFNRDKHKSK